MATKALITDNSLLIENPQIVNGLQASTEISFYSQKSNLIDEKRHVLVRVVTSPNDASRNRIIKATNSQTDMPYASLRATDKIHNDIEDHFISHGFYYDRKKNFYKNEGKPAKKIISISSLAQAVISTVLQRPNDARARPTTLLKTTENYKAIFSEDYPLDMYLNSFLLKNKIDFYLQTFPNKKDRTNCRFYALMLLAMRACASVKVTPDSLANINVDSVGNEEIAIASLYARIFYIQLGGNDNVAKGKAFIAKLKEGANEFVKMAPQPLLVKISQMSNELKAVTNQVK